MAFKGLSGLTGTKENGLQNQVGQNTPDAHNSPIKEGTQISYDGPSSHVDLLEFYFGHPSSVVKHNGGGLPRRSKW